jgi:hypothetical protein
MIDLLHLPKPQNGYVDYYLGKSGSLGGTWEIWEKPRGINMVRITTIGGGGGGGGGFASATTTARGGGGGGASGGYTSVLVPAIYLPDRLYVSAGRGGTGGTGSGVAGGAGFGSYVALAPYTALTGIYTVCFSNPGNGGGAGTAAVPGPAGTIGGTGLLPTLVNTLIAGLGIFTPYNGQTGALGGAISAGPGGAITYPTTGLLLSGGAGGGGGIAVGGNVTVPGQPAGVYFTTRTGGAATGVAGDAGVELVQPLLSTGGAGGGTAADGTAAGGNGGEGGFGSGGGGGGAGGATGGAGGDGGPGLVIIHSW